MKKLVSSLLALILLLGVVTPSYAAINESGNKSSAEKTKIAKEKVMSAKEQEKMIKAVEPYVKVTKEGTFKLENVPEKLYKKYELDQLQKHFDNLNASAKKGNITINEDLSIQDNSPTANASKSSDMTTLACQGVNTDPKWYWWGTSEKMDSCRTNDFIADLNTITAVNAGASLILVWFGFWPSLPAGISVVYFSLMAARADANDDGKGIKADITWALGFNFEPQ